MLLVCGQLLVAACLVAAIVSLVLRYRSGDEVLRLRVRWLMLAGVAIVALLVAGWVMSIGFEVALDVAYAPVLVAIVVLVPVAVAVAIVRHDLFDIDRLLSQSTAWMVTLVLSAATFGIVVLGVSEVVSRSSGLRPDGRRIRDRAGAAAAAPLREHSRRAHRGSRPLRGGRPGGAVRGRRSSRAARPRGDRDRAQGGARGSGTATLPRRGRLMGRPIWSARPDADGLTLTFGGDAIARIQQHERRGARPAPVGGAVARGRGPDRGVPAAARPARRPGSADRGDGRRAATTGARPARRGPATPDRDRHAAADAAARPGPDPLGRDRPRGRRARRHRRRAAAARPRRTTEPSRRRPGAGAGGDARRHSDRDGPRRVAAAGTRRRAGR